MGPHLMKLPAEIRAGSSTGTGRRASTSGAPVSRRCVYPGLPWSPEFMAAYEKRLGGPAGADR